MTIQLGILTALPMEFTAVCTVFGCDHKVPHPKSSNGVHYVVATLTKQDRTTIEVVITLTNSMGNNSAAIQATRMLTDFPQIEHVIMIGIAGAVPSPKTPETHVRLGDIVVSNGTGVIQYDLDKEESEAITIRNPPRPPGAALLNAVRLLEVYQCHNQRPWDAMIKTATDILGKEWDRPKTLYDVLKDDPNGAKTKHPKDASRIAGRPRVFSGAIASANKLLKNPRKRDFLRDKHNAKAVEMEGSGCADAVWELGKSYLVVRGTCDYCNAMKGNRWQNHAAIIAAAYARCVVELLATTAKSGPGGNAASPVNDEQTRRARDLVQINRLFNWYSTAVFDHFMDRLGYLRITGSGLYFLGGFRSVLSGTSFHLYDRTLEELVRNVSDKWSECLRYLDATEYYEPKDENRVILELDIATTPETQEARDELPKCEGPLRSALLDLQRHIKDNYVEIDLTQTGENELQKYWNDLRESRRDNDT